MNIAINGFGRIAKNFLRSIMFDPIAIEKLNVKTINIGPGNLEHVALLFRYDTLMGHYPGSVEQKNGTLSIDGYEIEIIAQADPLKIDWQSRNIDWVVDCSGKFTKREGAQKHIQSGAKAVLISAPAKGDDISIVPGVNDQMFHKERHKIVSLGSCTTNAFLPMLKILYDECGLEHAFMTTAHAYTNSQSLLDVDGKDPRRARAAALNIVPTSTGAATMVGKIIPELEGKVDAVALRVPVGVVSLLTIVFTSSQTLTVDHINDSFLQASTTTLKGIVDITMEPLVSSDFAGTHYSVVVDGLMTKAAGPLSSVSGWYDNEWAYSVRMKDFLLSID